MSQKYRDLESCDSFPKLLLRNAAVRGARPAMREKDFGIWQSWSWAEMADQVRPLACGLAALGLRRGDKLAIIGDNRPQLYWAMLAAQAIGAVPVPMYQDAIAGELKFVVEHAEAKIAVAEDQEQVDKLLEIRADCPRLEAIVYDDERGLRSYQDTSLNSFDDILDRGRAFDRENPGFFDAEVAAGKGTDAGIILYTSGTTGQPKGVVLTNDNLLAGARIGVGQDNLGEADDALSYLPMAWVGDYVGFAQSVLAGFCINCPESGATVMQDLREVGPTFFIGPPRIYENLLTQVMIRMADASPLKRRLFDSFMALARRVGPDILDGRPVGFGNRLLYGLGDLLVYGPLRNVLGFSRLRFAYTAGEAIGPDVFTFYRSLGVNLKQLYGQTEASVYVTIQPDGEVDAETVGPPAEGVEVEIAESGEVLYRCAGVFLEYYKNPEATAAAKTADGWVHTGDAGFFDAEGRLKIIDRAKDVGALNDGTMFAPKYLENKLKFFPHIQEAVTFGHQRDYAVAIVNIDLEAVASWAERRGIAYGSYQELAAEPRVYELIKGEVEQVNRDLAGDAQLAGSQIRRFLVLHKELDADDGEITRTRKVRRGFIAERYAPLVEALYGAAARAEISTEVTYEDGRTGMMRADLAISQAETSPTRSSATQASPATALAS